MSRIAPVLVVSAFAASCASVSQTTGPGTAHISASDETVKIAVENTARTAGPRRTRASVVDPKRLLVVEGAYSLIGKDTLVVKGQTFPNDCTGLVRAAYWYAGIDLAQDFSKYTGNGVTRMFKILESRGLLYATETPRPGDIIFWDNTYDRNEDGDWNDPLTHTGVVVEVADTGQIEYVHLNYRKGIIIEYMNLTDPDTNTRNARGNVVFVNSAMRMRGQVVNDLWLSSHLLREFGKGYLLQ
jgi:hypothetical protein